MAKKFENSTLNGKNRNKRHSYRCIYKPTCRRPFISHNENIGSEVPLFCCDSFPSGEAKNSKDVGEYQSTGRSVA